MFKNTESLYRIWMSRVPANVPKAAALIFGLVLALGIAALLFSFVRALWETIKNHYQSSFFLQRRLRDLKSPMFIAGTIGALLLTVFWKLRLLTLALQAFVVAAVLIMNVSATYLLKQGENLGAPMLWCGLIGCLGVTEFIFRIPAYVHFWHSFEWVSVGATLIYTILSTYQFYRDGKHSYIRMTAGFVLEGLTRTLPIAFALIMGFMIFRESDVVLFGMPLPRSGMIIQLALTVFLASAYIVGDIINLHHYSRLNHEVNYNKTLLICKFVDIPVLFGYLVISGAYIALSSPLATAQEYQVRAFVSGASAMQLAIQSVVHSFQLDFSTQPQS